jgi:xanthine dehydrogenase accessory factor
VRLGKALGYAVDAVAPEADRATFPEADRVLAQRDAASLRPTSDAPGSWLCAVVATMGQSDDDSLLAALALKPAYLGVVASRRASPRFGTPCSRAAARPTRSRESPIPPE